MRPKLPQRVLLVRLGAIGDVVNARVVASALRAHEPGVRIGWAVHDLGVPLVAGHPAIDCVHVWPRGKGLAGLRHLVREIRAERYELAIDLQRIAKSAALALASGAPRVLGLDRERTKEASWLLTNERVSTGDAQAHVVDQYLDFVRHLGIEASDPRFELPIDPGARARAQAWVDELGGAPIAIHVGATKPANRWPAERFAELARECLSLRAGPVCVTGGPDDRALGARVAHANARIRDLTGRTSLLELAELQRLSRIVVSCDSGPMHLAASVGTTVVALFGAADERRTGPYGPRHRIVRTHPVCAPCGLRECPRARHDCMLDLAVGDVLSALIERLKATGR